MGYSARKSAEFFVGQIVEERHKEIGKLKNEIGRLQHKVNSLHKSVEYRQNKAKKNQEIADWFEKLKKTPGVMKNGTIDWHQVYLLYEM